MPRYFDPVHHQAIKTKFAAAVGAKSRLYMPFPVIFEIANHIVDGREDGPRITLAKRFDGDVLSSFEKTVPFAITPSVSEEHLTLLLGLAGVAREPLTRRPGRRLRPWSAVARSP